VLKELIPRWKGAASTNGALIHTHGFHGDNEAQAIEQMTLGPATIAIAKTNGSVVLLFYHNNR
jgi:hypothetical protein